MPDTLDGRAKSIIDVAMDLHGIDRSAYLDRDCAGDAQLRCRVELLLASMEENDAFLNQPTVDIESVPSSEPVAFEIGNRIGPYALIERIGEGGFGSVYRAEQNEPVHRSVALKIIKLGMDTRQVIARFEAERQALALMDHPYIARVFDAGATDNGRPYFVMELVRGEHVTGYCDRERLSIRQRLELFRDICSAVQHAHQKGVIHRDIKPSNILVSMVDGRAVPKVIDFGIAKAITNRLTDQPALTELHQLVGTPEYMSPEQSELSGVDIDTRCDVFALGVLLFELLTGGTPFDRQRLREAPLAEMQRIIREEEPPRPSFRLQTLTASSSEVRFRTPDGRRESHASSIIEIAHRRRIEPPSLSRTVRGDLDWIVMKCLEKDRARRYETASALAEDIRRHMAHEPVVARPPSAGYRMSKFVRRFRIPVAVALTFLALLIASSAVAWRLYGKAELARGLVAEKNEQANGRLWDSLLAQARAGRSGVQPGRRFAGLEAIREAAVIRTSSELRNEAIACMGLSDIALVKTFHDVPKASAMGLRNPDRFAYESPDGKIHVVAIEDGHELGLLDGRTESYLHLDLQFSSNGEYLVAKYSAGNRRFHVDVWNLATRLRLIARDDSPVDPSHAFSPAGEWVALKESDQLVHFYHLPSADEFKRLDLSPELNKLKTHPSGRFLAASASKAPYVRVWDVVDDRMVSEFDMPAMAGQLDWSQDGRLLAAGGGDENWRIYVWDFESGKLLSESALHQNTVTYISFHPRAELIASQSWDHTSRFWDIRARRELLSPLHGWFVNGFGDLFACRGEQNDLSIWRFQPSRELNRLWAESPFGYVGGIQMARDGSGLVTATTNGVLLWNVEAGARPIVLSRQDAVWADFLDASRAVIAATGEGLVQWTLTGDDTTDQTGAPELIWPRKGIRDCCVNPADSTVLVNAPPELAFVDLQTRQVVRSLPGFPCMKNLAISPDSRWIFVDNWKGAGARLLDAASGETLKEFPGASVRGFFNSDGSRLLVANGTEFLLCETGTWTMTRRIQRRHPETVAGVAAFSNDGTMAAIANSLYEVQLLDLASGTVLATLPNADQLAVLDLCFSHDDRWLAAATVDRLIEVWDLPRVREGLRTLGLDW